jgi:chromosome segregation ATPase
MLTPVSNNEPLQEPEREELINLRKENQRLHAFAETFIRNKESEYKKQNQELTLLVAELRQDIATLQMDHETHSTALMTVQQTLVKDAEEWKQKYLDQKEKVSPLEQLVCEQLNLSGLKDLSLWLETVYQPLIQENERVKGECETTLATLHRYEIAMQTSEDQMKAIQQDLQAGKAMIEQAERYTQEMTQNQQALEQKNQWLTLALERKETEIHFLKSSLERLEDMLQTLRPTFWAPGNYDFHFMIRPL